MPRVFVVGATLPHGGTHMAYHVGRIAARHFGYRLVNVEPHPHPRIFSYDTPFETISVEAMEKTISEEDALIANPSFSSHMFGLRLKGKKLMYVQGFQSFPFLDCGFDAYVSVSSVVQGFLKTTYAIDTTVIPAFVALDALPQAPEWEARPKTSVLVRLKSRTPEHEAILAWLKQALRGLPVRLQESVGFQHEHGAFLSQLGSVRYLLNLSIAEGFGLVPLEAMAMGVCVTGLDGLAGRDYMRFGENSMAVSARELVRLPGMFTSLLAEDARAKALAAQGKKDALAYGYPAFRDAWMNRLSSFLGAPPR